MKKILPYIIPMLAGTALLSIPLLRDLHFESAMLAAVIGCFWGGWRAAGSISKQDFLNSIRILWVMYLASTPLFVFALITGCLTLDGIGFWIFIPLPSIFFGTAVGRLVRKFKFPFPKTLTVLMLLFCAVGVWMIEFFSFPQVYFYNHVWGLWPGPIYDEAVQLTDSLFYFRWITLLWIIMLWSIPSWNKNMPSKVLTVLAAVSLLFSYMNLDEAGIISPRETIQQRLGGFHQTKHFELFYDEDFYSQKEIEYWALRHEFHFQQITDMLEIDWPKDRKVESYLYAHAWQKKKITGAKFTSYVPIWLEQDQLHIAKQQLERVLKHELVHVLSKQFGNRLFNGSRSIGLIEGLAEGITKNASPRSTLHQIVAAKSPKPTAAEMKRALSWRGFYGKAGAISYTTSGSFVEFLLNHYPPENFKKAYATGDIATVYSASMEELTAQWHHVLAETPTDSVDETTSDFVFAQQSLFEKPCPHAVPRRLQLWDSYRFHLANRDTVSGYKVLDELHRREPTNEWIKNQWAQAQLHQQKPEQVYTAITPNDTLIDLQILKADALFLAGKTEKADSLLSGITPKINESSAPKFGLTLKVRESKTQWKYHLERRYLNQFPETIAEFNQQNGANKLLTFSKIIEERIDSLIAPFATEIHPTFQTEAEFNILLKAIDRLAFLGYTEASKKLIALLEKPTLRLRYRERLVEKKVWVQFVHSLQSVVD